jgi:hypothetical protein
MSSRRRQSKSVNPIAFIIAIIVAVGFFYWFVTDFGPNSLEKINENAKSFEVGK